MPQNPAPFADALVRTLRTAALLLLICAPNSGCINAGVMFGKVFFGNPMVKSAFEARTGVSLLKDNRKVAVVCTAPSSVVAEFDSLQFNLQEEVTRRMRLRKINVASDDEVISALNDAGGRFSKDALAAALPDVDYIIHIDIENFTHTEDGNPSLLRGRSNGIVYAYEVQHGPDAGGSPRALQVFYQEFTTEYPKAAPANAERMSVRVFRQKCVDQLADIVGRTFYDVETSELFN